MYCFRQKDGGLSNQEGVSYLITHFFPLLFHPFSGYPVSTCFEKAAKFLGREGESTSTGKSTDRDPNLSAQSLLRIIWWIY